MYFKFIADNNEIGLIYVNEAKKRFALYKYDQEQYHNPDEWVIEICDNAEAYGMFLGYYPTAFQALTEVKGLTNLFIMVLIKEVEKEFDANAIKE